MATSLAGGVLDRQNADGLILALVSLQQWTPFYWEQDRFGMLVPLLTNALDDPFATLAAQHALTSFFGLMAFFGLSRFALGRGGPWFAAGAFSATAYAVTHPSNDTLFYYLSTIQPSGTSLALAAGALVAWREDAKPTAARVAVGSALALLAIWVNVAAAVFLLVTLLADRALHRGASAPSWAAEGATLASLGAIELAMVSSPYGTNYGPLSPEEWPAAAAAFLSSAASGYLGAGLGLALLAGAFVSTALAWRSELPWRRPLAIGAGAVAYLCAFAVLAWTEGNARYALLPFAALTAAVSIIPLQSLHSRTRRGVIEVLATVALITTMMLRFGPPEPERSRRELHERFGAATPELLASGVSHLFGDYWHVWPAVFHTNWVLHDLGRPQSAFGVTFRSNPTRAQWEGTLDCDTRVAILGPLPVDWVRSRRVLEGGRLEVLEEGREMNLAIVRCADAGDEPVR
ncbi:MAG: hypothetical protein JRH10_15325 [Deltaproteobacteria bacterium]|nr:hypothetical protein [Deltaproteobacteria bacterium]MBW2448289.1 hypothetical protein [Deltaproteobacteria bacterium]